MNIVEDLLSKHKIISDQIEKSELRIILNNLNRVLNDEISGDIVEFGCYEGTTSLFISRLILSSNVNKKFYVYDSFEGLPDKSEKDQAPSADGFQKGALSSSKTKFLNNYTKANLPIPIIKKAWFSELKTNDLPLEISFAFLDSDFYESIFDSLELIWPKMQPGSIIVVDDYYNNKLPGVRKAVDSFLSGKKMKYIAESESLAIIRL
jgi:O-methyltransferase